MDSESFELSDAGMLNSLSLGVFCGIRFPVVDSNKRLAGDGGPGVRKLDGRGGRLPWLVLGRDLLKDDVGRDVGPPGLSIGKKLDLRLRGEGEGGIWERVSMVLSDREGLGLRGSVRDWVARSGWTSSIVPAADVSTACDLMATERLLPRSASDDIVVLVVFRGGLSGKVRFFTAYLVGSGGGGGGAFVAVRGIGSLDNLGIPDALRLL